MGKLRMMRQSIRTLDLSIAKLPAKTADPFYLSPEWRETRNRVLKRDGYRCVAPGCTARATVVDHIISRRDGGSDHDSNLRSLCATHDNRVKEDAAGHRRSEGRLG